jgi:hypothetical protein
MGISPFINKACAFRKDGKQMLVYYADKARFLNS